MKPLSPPPLLLPPDPARAGRPSHAPAYPSGKGFSPPSAPPALSAEAIDRRLRKLKRLRAEREMEFLRVYQPVPAAVDFHASLARYRFCAGSNRSGKTQSVAFDVVSRMAGCHPHLKTRPQGEVVYMLGRDQQHLAEGIWPTLALPGAIRLIRDEHTRAWRPVRPDQPYDAANKEKWRDAPPMIPPRLIRSVSMEDKKAGVPRRVIFTNGSKMVFYTANSAPRRGFKIDGAWVDEECENEEWLKEIFRGLTDRAGWFVYSFTPQSGTQWAKTKWDEATSPFNLNRPNGMRRFDAFKFLIPDNPYIDAEAKLTIKDGCLDDRDLRVRWHGEFSLDERIVYSEFSREQHVVKPFFPGPDWNRYLVIDPGITRAAVLFVAVAPNVDEAGRPHENAGEVHVYDELYPERCGAEAIAYRVAARIEADNHAAKAGCFVAFMMDWHAGRQPQLGSGRSVQNDYVEAFRKLGLRSRMTGSSFLRGSDDTARREDAVHRLMQPNYPSGKPRLKVHDRAKGLLWEIPKQTRKKDAKSGLVLEQRERKDNHSTDCLEYFADYDPDWIYYPPVVEGEGRVWKEFLARKKKSRDTEPVLRFAPP